MADLVAVKGEAKYDGITVLHSSNMIASYHKGTFPIVCNLLCDR